MKNSTTVLIVYLDGGKRVSVELEGPLTAELMGWEEFSILQFRKGRQVLLAIPATSLISSISLQHKVKLKLVG